MAYLLEIENTHSIPHVITHAIVQGSLDKAQQLNTSAREVFEFIARCARASNSSTNGSVAGGTGFSVGGSTTGSVTSSKKEGEKTLAAGRHQAPPPKSDVENAVVPTAEQASLVLKHCYEIMCPSSYLWTQVHVCALACP